MDLQPPPKFHIRDAGSALVEQASMLYAAYTVNSHNLNYRGEQCPSWDALPDSVQSHWCAAAAAANLDSFRHLRTPELNPAVAAAILADPDAFGPI